MELLLDGTDLDSALRSLAAAPQVDPADLDAAIVSYEDDFAASVEESPAWSIPRQIFARLGADVDALSFDTARYFHGTGVRDPADFLARGILPLGPMVDQLWSMLYELVSDERTELLRDGEVGPNADGGVAFDGSASHPSKSRTSRSASPCPVGCASTAPPGGSRRGAEPALRSTSDLTNRSSGSSGTASSSSTEAKPLSRTGGLRSRFVPSRRNSVVTTSEVRVRPRRGTRCGARPIPGRVPC
jgi:hypothetical protein